MATKVFNAQYLYSQIKSVDVGILFVTCLISVFIVFVFVVLRYTFWRRKYTQTLPGHKFSMFNVFGNLLDLSFYESARNGLSFNVSEYTTCKNLFIFKNICLTFSYKCIMQNVFKPEFIN